MTEPEVKTKVANPVDEQVLAPASQLVMHPTLEDFVGAAFKGQDFMLNTDQIAEAEALFHAHIAEKRPVTSSMDSAPQQP